MRRAIAESPVRLAAEVSKIIPAGHVVARRWRTQSGAQAAAIRAPTRPLLTPPGASDRGWCRSGT